MNKYSIEDLLNPLKVFEILTYNSKELHLNSLNIDNFINDLKGGLLSNPTRIKINSFSPYFDIKKLICSVYKFDKNFLESQLSVRDSLYNSTDLYSLWTKNLINDLSTLINIIVRYKEHLTNRDAELLKNMAVDNTKEVLNRLTVEHIEMIPALSNPVYYHHWQTLKMNMQQIDECSSVLIIMFS